MSSLTSAPTTLAGIKHRARSIKKSQHVPHHEALKQAAQAAGFKSYKDACRALGADSAQQ